MLEDYPNHEEILQKTAARLVGYSGRMEKFTLTTTERLEQLAGDVEEIQKKIDSYYLHFLVRHFVRQTASIYCCPSILSFLKFC